MLAMRNIQRNTLTTFVIALFALLVGCTQPEPVIIYVTPTPLATLPEEMLLLPSETATQTATLTETPLNPTATATLTEAPVTNTASAPLSESPQPTVTFMGAIIGEGYRPPPSATPQEQPSATPAPQEASPEATAAPTRVGTPLPTFDTTNIGIQSISFLTQEDWNVVMMQTDDQLQMGWIKLQVAWDFFQPNSPDEITEEFRRFEIFVEQVRQQRQVKVLLSIAKAPDWSRSDTTEDGPPDDPQALANFISLILRDIGSSVDAVEVWNEPNLAREWRGQPLTGASYMRYFEASYNAIRAYSPNIIVVSAGLAPTSNTESSRDDREYLQEMYNAGLARYPDVKVGAHPYGWGNPPDARCCSPGGERGWDEVPQFFFLDTIEDYRNIMVANGHTDAKLWLTEFGWATWEGLPGDPPDLWMTYNTKWDQANYAFRAIEIAQSLDYVETMFLWNLNFAQPILIENRDERIAYSIVLPEGAPRERPLFWMLYDATRPDVSLDRYD